MAGGMGHEALRRRVEATKRHARLSTRSQGSPASFVSCTPLDRCFSRTRLRLVD